MTVKASKAMVIEQSNKCCKRDLYGVQWSPQGKASCRLSREMTTAQHLEEKIRETEVS